MGNGFPSPESISKIIKEQTSYSRMISVHLMQKGAEAR
jgi:hypothetical protein